MAELPVGGRVAYWRRRRKLSQQVFADRLGKSKSWVDKVERGERRLDRFSVLHQIASVLQIDVAQLLTDPESGSRIGAAEPIDLGRVRGALAQFAPAAHFGAPAAGPPLADLVKSVEHAWLTFQYARYAMLVAALPRLIHGVRSADAHCSGDNAVRAADLLGQVYQIASSTLRKLGSLDLARICAERSIEAALRADNPLLAGTGTTRFANALLAAGQARQAYEANIVLAHRLAPTGATWADPDRVSVYGSLLLQGAMAAAHRGDNASVRELLAEAGVAAEALGADDNRYRTSFGPTNVELHRAAAAVELGEGRQAIDTHVRRIDPRRFAALPPERRAQHLLDTARAHVLVGNLADAGESLVTADRLAPDDIRTRPAARDVMSEILRRSKGTPATLVTELADRMGARI